MQNDSESVQKIAYNPKYTKSTSLLQLITSIILLSSLQLLLNMYIYEDELPENLMSPVVIQNSNYL